VELDKKVALVTGALGGLGQEICLALARGGCSVAANYFGKAFRRDAEGLTDQIKALGCRAIAVDADITKPDEVKRMVERTLEEFNTVDIYVNSAGFDQEASLLELTEETWDAMVSGPQLKGAFLCCRTVASTMLKNKLGKIVLLAGSTAFIGSAQYPHYASMAVGVVTLVKSLAKGLAPFVNVNGVAPAHIETHILKSCDEITRNRIMESIPLKRFGKPSEVADAVLFLVTNDYVTGHTLLMTGGWVM